MFDAFMISAGFTRSRSDVCMYHKGDRDNKVIVLVYVDDIIVASKHDTLLDEFYTTMSARFQIESDALHYYVGMQITIDVGASASINQSNYINRICKRADVSVNKKIITPMSAQRHDRMTRQMSPSDDDAHDQEMMTSYRSNVSSIMCAAVHSRPDVTYSANLAARFTPNPGEKHGESVTRIFQYLMNTTDKHIIYTRSSDVHKRNQLVCYVITSHADSDDLRTTVGYVI
jgi:hypothetical protein